MTSDFSYQLLAYHEKKVQKYHGHQNNHIDTFGQKLSPDNNLEKLSPNI